MQVTSAQLNQYSIPADQWFAHRTEIGDTISRDQFFINNPNKLLEGVFCAIGSETTDQWTLEQFNGVNWKVVEPDPSYSLIITNGGLAAVNDVQRGGLQLFFTGIKVINRIVSEPDVPVINWTDTDLLRAGEVKFSVGTNGSPNKEMEDQPALINSILSWRFNTGAGGLQYIVTLPPEGLGAIADNGDEKWEVGTIGLYVKDPIDRQTDVLFGVATLPNLVTKYATSIERVGNAIKLYFNAICNNLGVISNLDVLHEEERSLAEVPNETLLMYPTAQELRPQNCYLVNNLYGTNTPALAIPRGVDSDVSWAFLQPSQNFMQIDPKLFDISVTDYMLTYFDIPNNKYMLAEGREEGGVNPKTPVGIRVGNSIIYEGEIHNTTTAWTYELTKTAVGSGYREGDELLITYNDSLVFKIEVLTALEGGGIDTFRFVGPQTGNVPIEQKDNEWPIRSTTYDPRSQLPRNGLGSRFQIVGTEHVNAKWDFADDVINKPVYCSSTVPGTITTTETDSFVGWCSGPNSIRLSLDLRSEATNSSQGTTRYATPAEANEGLIENISATPLGVSTNFLQKTKGGSHGNTMTDPEIVDTFVKFNQTVLGKGAKAPYTDATNPNITDSEVAFYGTAYRAYWADLAEFYEADKYYEPGTLITIGLGKAEMTAAVKECNGIISTKPGYQLGEKKSENSLPVALVGRVPVLFDGLCMPKFGDKIYLSKTVIGRASTVENGKCLGKIIQKNFGTSKCLECAVRIEF